MVTLAPWYLWLKAFHIIAFTAWMAGIFYLPRLFVYHSTVDHGSESCRRFQTMERRLIYAIMMPAMLATLFFGSLLAAIPGLIDYDAPWWWIKVACVIGLVIFQILCEKWRRDFARARQVHTERFFRIVNEAPTILLILIVVMIVVRP